jgi:type I restriction enzyme S subunit
MKMAETSLLINIFKGCLDILRDNEGLTGDKALRTLSQFLILKLIEPRLDTEIKIKEYNYGDFGLQDEYVEEHKKKMFEIVYFSKLVEEKDINIHDRMKDLWDGVLSKNPITKNIFVEGKCFDLKQSTYRKILNRINKINIKEREYDVLGNAYEEVIQDIMTGKVLGQFFTQPLVKKMMVELINPKIYQDGKIESCGDPTMGTGGFLITYLRDVIEKANKNGIKLDWEFIKKEGIYGKELEPDTYQLAVSNMLIASGHLFENLERGDSIRNPIERKFDNILANPPYGIKGLNYDEFESSIKEEYTPIKTNNAVSLFIQAIIYMLKVNGKCAVVLPDGQDLFSKTNTTLVQVREYLMKTCDLKEIIYLPSGIFTYTSIKTCVFYFVKKKEGDKVVEIKRKISKTQKETGRTYKFEKEHQTHNVKFYEYDFEKDNKNLLVEVSIDDIKKNRYSLNYSEYIKEEEEQYNKEIEIKTLGEVCEIKNGYAFKSNDYEEKNKNNIGIIKIKSIQNGYITLNGIQEYTEKKQKYNNFEVNKGDILIALSGATTGKIGIYNEETISYLNQRIAKINVKDNKKFIQKYVYYVYILQELDKIVLNLAGGTAQPNISSIDLSKIKIPIPTIETQKEIVEYLDYIYEISNKTTNEKIKQLKKLNEYCVNNQKKYGKNEIKEIGEICKFLPKSKRQASYGKETGKYPFFKSSMKVNTYVDEPDYKEESLIIGTGGNANIKYGVNFSCSTDNLVITINYHLTKYVYYYFINNMDKLENEFIGTGIKHISKQNFKKIKIPIPTIEIQKEIVEYCERNDQLIKKLEEEIKMNENNTKNFLNNILK